MQAKFERLVLLTQPWARAVFEYPKLALTVIWLVLSWLWLSGQRAIPWDSIVEFYPGLAFAAQQLREGAFPWWNPYIFAGYPQFADPQAMTFQPSMVLPLLLSDLPSLAWFDVIVVLHVLVAGIGALAVARSYRFSPLPQLLLALTFMYGGVAASRMQHTPMLISYCFLPWLWWGLRRLAERPDGRGILLTGLFGGLCALQLTQVTYLIALLMGGYALWLLVQHPSGKRRRNKWQTGGAMLAAALIALLLSSPQWLSTLAFLPFSNRAELPLAAANDGTLWPAALATLLAGNVFSHTIGAYWGPGDLSTDYLYVGIIPLVAWLRWGGGGQYRDGQRGESWFWLLVLALSLLYALGTRTPFYEWLYRVLPGLTLFRRPADALFLTVPALGLLGAMALDRRLAGQPTRPHGLALLAASALLGYTLWLVLTAHRPQALLALLYSAVMGGALLWLLRRAPKATAGALLAVLLLSVVDLRLHNVVRDFNAQKNPDLALFRLPLAADGARLIAQWRGVIGDQPIPERIELLGGLPQWVNGASVFGIGNITGYNPMLYSRYVRMFGVGSFPPAAAAQRTFTDWAPDYSARAFDLLGLRQTVNNGPNGIDGQYRESVLPRILHPVEARFHDDDLPPPDAFRSTNFSRTLWLPAAEAGETVCANNAVGKLRLGSVKYTPNEIVIEYAAEEAPAWLVLNEIYLPGWHARVDHEEIPLLRGNGIFRAMCVPAGAHRLVVAFAPGRFLAAGWQEHRR